MAQGPKFSIASVIPLPMTAGNVAALALTTEPGAYVYPGCVVKSKSQSESLGRRASRSSCVAAPFS